MSRRAFLFTLVFFVASLAFVTAHTETTKKGIDFTEPVLYIKLATAIVIFVVLLLFVLTEKFVKKHTKLLFLLIVLPVALSSLYIAGHTVYSNAISVTKGPVHWHADYEVDVCGKRLDLIDPRFPKNKIGTPLFHEHNDDRMHIEGTVDHLEDLSLGTYFSIIGGALEPGHLAYRTNDGAVEVRDGDDCNGKPGTLKVYVNGKKIDNYQDYILYPSALVPPGDCIIVAFDQTTTDTTDVLCESWEVNDWNYDSVKRKTVTIGGHTWQ